MSDRNAPSTSTEETVHPESSSSPTAAAPEVQTAAMQTQVPSAEAQGTLTDAQGTSTEATCADPQVKLAETQAKLAEAQAKIVELQDRCLRTMAEFDNYRRRSMRDREDARTAALAGLLSDLLPAFDNFRLAIESARQHHPEAKTVIEGIALIQSQIQTALVQNGIKEVLPAVGDKLDPAFHESIAYSPHDQVPEGAISQVVRSGCLVQERLIRPATVVVSSGPAVRDA